MNIAEKIALIAEKIKEVNPCAQILAATKTRSVEEIREAVGTGLVAGVGENRVRELLEKYSPDFRWDFIGRLQTNKAKYLPGKVTLIHSLDRLSLASVLEKEYAKRGEVCRVLIEINTGKEPNKGGVFLEETESFLERLREFGHIEVKGLMAVTPLGFSPAQSEKAFDAVYEKYIKLADGYNFNCLSMGMSGDYLVAAKHGSNLVRIGRAIFGERL